MMKRVWKTSGCLVWFQYNAFYFQSAASRYFHLEPFNQDITALCELNFLDFLKNKSLFYLTIVLFCSFFVTTEIAGKNIVVNKMFYIAV